MRGSRSLPIALAVAAVAALAATLAIPNIGQSQAGDARLVRRVSSLERQVRVLSEAVRQLQRNDRTQVSLNLLQGSRITTLENKEPTVSVGVRGFTLLEPRTSGRASSACLTGRVVGGTIDTSLASVYATETMVNPLTNSFSANGFNQATSQSASFAVNAICLD